MQAFLIASSPFRSLALKLAAAASEALDMHIRNYQVMYDALVIRSDGGR